MDAAAFPEGGLWLCCGSKSKNGLDERCTLGLHAVAEVAPVAEERRIEDAPQTESVSASTVGRTGPCAAVSFIESSFTTKVDYLAWLRTLSIE